MTGADLFVVLGMLILVGIASVKIGNVMRFGMFYDKMYIFISLFVAGIFYLLILLTTIAEHTMLYAMYLNVANYVFMFTVILTIAEIIISLAPRGRKRRI